MKTGAFPSPLLRTLTALALSPFLGLSLHGAAPVLEEPVPSAGTPKVVPVVPVGKALLIPLSAYDSDGDSLSFSVTSSNPNIMARVKTGNPLLQMQVFHGAGAANDPTYTGTMVFQLFRDWTPMTTGLISGFAQSGLYDGIKLQRLADLNDDKNAATPAAVTESFIYQGGASVGFQFENEFSAPLLFSGRGQLCMANAGTNNYKGTNGGQFFITNGNFFNTAVKEVTSGGPRHLDFKHTVFGQLTHGWDVLQKLHDTPRDGSDQPLVDVKVITASVSPQYNEGTHVYTDGVLVLTAKGPGPPRSWSLSPIPREWWPPRALRRLPRLTPIMHCLFWCRPRMQWVPSTRFSVSRWLLRSIWNSII